MIPTPKQNLKYWIVCLAIICLALTAMAQPAPPQPNAPGLPADALQPIHDKAALIDLTGPVDNVMFSSLQRRVDLARKAGCTLIVYRIDNSGGMISSGLQIAAFTRKLASENMHVVAWVNSRAISPGAIVAVSCQQIVMASTGMLGDCSSIEVHEEDAAAAPVLADLAASAKQNGYDPTLLSAMVIPSIEIDQVRNNTTGEIRFVDKLTKDKLLAEEVPAPGGAKDRPWKYVEETDSTNQVLTVNADTALQMGLSKRSINSEQELRAALNIRGDLLPLDYNGLEATTRWLTQAWLRLLLFVLMLMFIGVEIAHPGTSLPIIAAIFCLIVLVGAPYLTGLAQVWEIILIVLGLGIIVFDIFVLGGLGFLAIPGFILVAIGLVASFVPSEPGGAWYPSMSETWTGLRTGLAVLVFGSLASVAGFALLSKYLYMTPGFRKLQLAPSTGITLKTSPSADVRDLSDRPAGEAVFLGAIGVASTDLRPAGKVRFDQHLVDVVSFGMFIPRGAEVQVTEIAGSKVVVKPRPTPDSSQVT